MRIREFILLSGIIIGIYAAPSLLLAQTKTEPRSEISVRISAPKRTVTVGTVIQIEVRVANSGDEAVLVPNYVSTASGGLAYLEFELTDARGRVSPSMKMIAEYPPVKQSDDDAATKLLGSWTLLHPHTSLLFNAPIGKDLFTFLDKSGQYRLSATYASNGILYGRNGLGLSKELLTSLPYLSWQGKVATNEISLVLVSPNKRKVPD